MPKSKSKKSTNTDGSTEESTQEGFASSSESMLESFERELQWCIDQLELGLQTQNSNSKQATEAVKVLKILHSNKAPLVKKRQVMRNTFGDYRAKMRKEQSKSAAAAKKMKLSSVEQTGYLKSQFFKKSASQKSQTQFTENTSAEIDSDKLGQKGDNSSANLNESFKFNFSLSENVTEPVTDANMTEGEKLKEAGKLENDKPAVSGNESTFKMEKSGNMFRFDFDVSDKT